MVTAFDGSGYALVPPGQVPATIDGLTFSDGFPADWRAATTTSPAPTPDGTIIPLVFPTAPTGGPQSFTIERADGCTTFTGAAESMFGLAQFVTGRQDRRWWLPTVWWKRCPRRPQPVRAARGARPTSRPVSVVQSGGKWYVSPLGTALASTSTALHDVKDGSSLFDSPLAPFIYGGLSRATLESMVKGQSVDTIDPQCLPALTVDNGVVTGVVADPPPDAVRACGNSVSFGGGQVSATGSASATGVATPTQAPPPVVAKVPIVESSPVTTAP